MSKRYANAKTAKLKAFSPIASANARVLILGSMPSAVSLTENQYYAHPRNHFWKIIGALFNTDSELSYIRRCRKLIVNHIALWDVIATCARSGSLDSDIAEQSIRVNNFNDFFKHHTIIHTVFFNGSKAEQVYRKYVLHTLSEEVVLSYVKLPSTSPANATWNFAEKLKAWQVVKQKADIIAD